MSVLVGGGSLEVEVPASRAVEWRGALEEWVARSRRLESRRTRGPPWCLMPSRFEGWAMVALEAQAA